MSINLLDAMADTELFGSWFAKNPESWAAWQAFIASLFALSMTPEQEAIYRARTGRVIVPAVPAKEAWLVCGRRAGKSFVVSLIAVFLATFRDYRPFLAPGERATIAILAADRKQARSIFRYIGALLRQVPMLAEKIERETADAFDLNNSVTIEVGTASYSSTRGYTYAAVLADELAFWGTGDVGADQSDYAVLNAVRPGMLTIPGAILLCASSPYARRGALWDAFNKWFGKDVPQLVWHGATRDMNPTVPQAEIDQKYEDDPVGAASEYGAEFRSADARNFLTDVAVGACIDDNIHERRHDAMKSYVGFVDPSGGRGDAMTMAIAHKEGKTSILDVIREIRAPYSPEAAVSEFASVFKSYRISSVQGDNYGAEWVSSQFRSNGIHYKHSDLSRSQIYIESLPEINAHSFRLLDNDRLTNQLLHLERRVSRSGRDIVDHPRKGMDDVANSALGALVMASREKASNYGMRRRDRERLMREHGQHEMADPLEHF